MGKDKEDKEPIYLHPAIRSEAAAVQFETELRDLVAKSMAAGVTVSHAYGTLGLMQSEIALRLFTAPEMPSDNWQLISLADGSKQTIAWEPLPGSQALAVGCPCDEILYHGTRGPGKTEAQLAYFVARCGFGYGSAWRGVIFDRGYKNLDDLIAKSLEMIPKIFPNAKFLSSKSDLNIFLNLSKRSLP